MLVFLGFMIKLDWLFKFLHGYHPLPLTSDIFPSSHLLSIAYGYKEQRRKISSQEAKKKNKSICRGSEKFFLQ